MLIALDLDHVIIFIVNGEAFSVKPTPVNMYAGPIGRARAKQEIIERDRYFADNANAWGCGLQDHFGEITDMIAEEAGIPLRERYALRRR